MIQEVPLPDISGSIPSNRFFSARESLNWTKFSLLMLTMTIPQELSIWPKTAEYVYDSFSFLIAPLTIKNMISCVKYAGI